MSDLRLFRSNRIELLARLLAAVVRDNLPRDPMDRIDVVVGSAGMARWLRHALAEQPEVPICANVGFPFPAAAVDSLLDSLVDGAAAGDARRVDPWAPDTLMWALLEVLPTVIELPELEPVRTYLQASPGKADPVDGRQLALARHLANLFDRYVTYRPELARAWSGWAGEAAPAVPVDLTWQRVVWRKVQERIGPARHRADRIAQAVELLRAGRPIPGLRGPLYIFGVSSLPPSWLSLLSALSVHIEVDLFLLSPSPAYWAELHRALGQGGAAIGMADRDTLGEELANLRADTAHPLLASMGRVARDFQIVLESQPDHFVTEQVDAFPDAVAAAGDRVLSWLQADLAAAVAPNPEGRTADENDDSVQFHSCHGPTRQVEVLRNVILGLLDDHRELEPRHIVVMTPDIEVYAPLITAVFSQGATHRMQRDGKPVAGPEGWGPAGAPTIPFEIVDRSVRRINPVADVLLRVLDLVDSRLPASAVVDVLTLEPVRVKFGLSPDDVTTAQEWIEQSGIRWARDAAHRALEQQPCDPQNTWRFGIRRLLLGVVMADDGGLIAGQEAPDVPTYVRPFDDMEEDTTVLGRLVDFCNTLLDLTARLRGPRPAAQWVRDLGEVLDRMTALPGAAAWLDLQVREEIASLGESLKASGSERDITLDAIRMALDGRFDIPSRLTKEQSGAVTFCAMRPMRSVPYDVVCLLGMDEGSFPRKGASLAFDITARVPRVGDMNVRDEDRYLLLEAILAARKHLVVLYTGRDPTTNAATAPCVPIGELRELVDQTAKPPVEGKTLSAWLTTDHPIQAFSPSAFAPADDGTAPAERRRWSFDGRLAAGVKARYRKIVEPQPFVSPVPAREQTSVVLSIEDLIRFLKSPAEFLLRRQLRVSLEVDAEAIPDREPITLDPLDRWKLRHELLTVGWSDLSDVARYMKAGGMLPLGQAGQAAVDREAALVGAMRAAVGMSGTQPMRGERIAIDLVVGGARLKGSIPAPSRNTIVEFEFGDETPKRLARAWVSLLAWRASCADAGRAATVFGNTPKGVPKAQIIGFELKSDATPILERLVQACLRGHREPIPLFPVSSWRFAFNLGKTYGDDFLAGGLPEEESVLSAIRKAHEDARKHWDDEDSRDPYVARLFEGDCPVDDLKMNPIPLSLEFARLSRDIYFPMVAARCTDRVAKKWFAEAQR
jgi:exodeoxyribonuclease V gamma subunit